VVAIQIFDQRKFKRKHDQGFLGVVNILVSSIFDPIVGGEGTPTYIYVYTRYGIWFSRVPNADILLQSLSIKV
jgi:hypothetical protein